MLFNAISVHKKKLVAEAEAAEAEREAAKAERRRVNSKRLNEAKGKTSAEGQAKTFMQALTDKRKVRSCIWLFRVVVARLRFRLPLV